MRSKFAIDEVVGMRSELPILLFENLIILRVRGLVNFMELWARQPIFISEFRDAVNLVAFSCPHEVNYFIGVSLGKRQVLVSQIALRGPDNIEVSPCVVQI